jgi:DNA helicase-2/ATP-dependent DNA helicase PcrA
MLAYLHAIANPDDEVSVKRVLNVPRRGVGDTSVARLDAWATARGLPFSEALNHARDAGVTGKAVAGIASFLELMSDLRAMLAGEAEEAGHAGEEGGRSQAEPAELLQAVLDRTNYLDELRSEGDTRVEVEGRIENVEELLGAAREVATLADFLTEVSLVADTDELTSDDSTVTLMTLHTAKGLEYPIVFIAGMEEGIFPHLRALGEPHELEEERRLCYVGVTRARERLYLSHAWCRSLWGDAQYNQPSRFMAEIPDHLVRSSAASLHQNLLRQRQSRSEVRSQLIEAAMHRGKPGAPVQGTGAEALGLRAGEAIMHARYGEGLVLEVSGEGTDAEAVIRFPSVGEKRFSLHLAPIKRA